MEIEKNTPIPANKGGRPAKYDWLFDLEDGDCVKFDNWPDFENCRYAMRYRGIKHTTRTRKTNQREEYRIWVTS